MPIACLDVNYLGDHTAKVAGVLFHDWADEVPTGEQCLTMPTPAEYEPGQFYKREMPCLLALLRQWTAAAPSPDILVIDGYVTLGEDRPGLGHHLYHALGQQQPVIGVAKRNFQDNATARPLLRGGSQRPLFITAIGMEVTEALECIRSMHGPHRMPALLRRADQLSKGKVTGQAGRGGEHCEKCWHVHKDFPAYLVGLDEGLAIRADLMGELAHQLMPTA